MLNQPTVAHDTRKEPTITEREPPARNFLEEAKQQQLEQMRRLARELPKPKLELEDDDLEL